MNLKSKLARLSPPISPRSEVEVGATDGSSPIQETLQQLRARMDAILHRPLPEPPVRANPSETSLPFLPANRGNGKLHRRLMRVAKSKTIGRIPVDAAATARSGLLSLLALDPSLLPCDPKRALYLDTETTGLGGGAGTIAFLIGLAWFDDDDLWLEQLLLTSPSDEPALLECLDERLQSASMLVTFNGKSFDWPLLLGRYVMNRRERPAAMPHLDLLHVARRLHKRRLGSVTLKRL
ncbi:MAG TPA: ribonuclease H-like domain-containing protein, partial [Polyangiaceae bacterium]